MKKYIYYGDDKFDISKFEFPTCRCDFNKPNGGLWASPVEPKNIGWYEWCVYNVFYIERLDRSFIFSLIENAKIFTITSIEDLKKFYSLSKCRKKIYDPACLAIQSVCYARLLDQKYDAIEFELNNSQLYFDLYGWDVDSLLVLNPDCVVPE